MNGYVRRWFARAILVAIASPLVYVWWRGNAALFDPNLPPGKTPLGIAIMEGIAVIVDGALLVIAPVQFRRLRPACNQQGGVMGVGER